MRSPHRRLVAAILLVAFALRLFRLGDQNPWWDEALAIWAVRKSFLDATLWTAGDVHPPLFFWTLWVWVRLAGDLAYSARFIAVIWGMLAVCLAGALGRQLAGRRGGLIALALVGLARFEVWWSMELRMYMLAGLCVLGATLATLRWLRRPSSARRLVAYGLFASAGLYTLYMSAAALALLNLVVLTAWLRRKLDRAQLLHWALTQVAIGLAYVPWLAIALPRLSSWRVPGEPASPAFVTQLWTTLLATGVSTDLSLVAGWVWLWWVAAILAMAAAARRMTSRATILETHQGGLDEPRPRSKALLGPLTLALFAIAAPLFVWAATQPRSIFYSPRVEARYFVPFAAPVYVLVAVAVAWLWSWRPRIGALLLAVLLGLQVLALPGHFVQRHTRDMTQSMNIAIWSQAEPGDVVLLVSGNRYPLFHFDYDRQAGAPPVIPFPSMGSEVVNEHPGWEDDLAKFVSEHPRIWLVELDQALQDADRQVFRWLSDHRKLVLSEAYGANALHLFGTGAEPPQATREDLVWSGAILDPPYNQLMADRWSTATPTEPPTPTKPATATPSPIPGTPTPGRCYRPCAEPKPPPHWASAWTPAKRLYPGDLLAVTVVAEVLRKATDLEVAIFGHRDQPIWIGRSEGGLGTNRRRVVATVDERWPAPAWLEGSFGVLARPVFTDSVPADWALVAKVNVEGVPWRSTELDSCRVTAAVGPLRLCHGGMRTRVLPGHALVVDLRWMAEKTALAALPPTTTVFVHLVGPPRPESGDPVWAAGDGLPSSGPWGLERRPFFVGPDERWFDAIGDRHILDVDSAAPPGRYALEVGLYDPATGTRYPVERFRTAEGASVPLLPGESIDQANRRVILGTVDVVAPKLADRLITNLTNLWR